MRTIEKCLFVYLSVLFVGFCHGMDSFSDSALQLPESYKIGWMEAIDDHKLISGITIPGTHDTMALHGGPVAECQAWDLEDQLKAGVRYLDLSVFAFKKHLYVTHGLVNEHKSFSEVLKTIKDFLFEFKSETVLVRVTPALGEHFISLFVKDTVVELVGRIINEDNSVWVKSDMPTMGKARGKVIFVQARGFKVGVPLLETDKEEDHKVSHIANKEKKIAVHLSQASGQCGKTAIVLSHSSGTGFGTLIGMSLTPKKIARLVNPWLDQYLLQLFNEHRVCFGVVAMDFPGFDLIQTIIKLNPRLAFCAKLKC